MIRKKTMTSPTVIALSLVLAVSALGCAGATGPGTGATTGGAAAAGDSHALIGKPAPDFSLASVNGQGKFSLASMKGKVVIVDFWATWCEPCRHATRAYQALAARYPGRVVVIGVSVDDEPDGIADFARQTGATFPLVWDRGGRVAERYRPPSMPTSYVLGRDGVVRYVHSGWEPGDAERIEAEVARLLRLATRRGTMMALPS